MFEIALVRHAQHSRVEKRLRGRHDDLAVAIVLHLLVGRIAHAHRPHAAIAGKMLGLEFVKLVRAHHRIERLDLPAARLVDDVAQIGEIFLEHVERAQRHAAVFPAGIPAIARRGGEVVLVRMVDVTAQHAGERDDLAKRGHAAQVPLRAGEGALRVLSLVAQDGEAVGL